MTCSHRNESSNTEMIYSTTKDGKINCKQLENGIVMLEYTLTEDSLLHGIFKEYHSNGQLKTIGQYYRGEKGNDFRHFDAEGNLRMIAIYDENLNSPKRELILTEYINFSRSGDTLMDSSYFFRISPYVDSIRIGESVEIEIYTPTMKYDSLNGYFQIIKQEDRYKEFEGLLFKGGVNKTLSLYFPPILRPGNYLILGVIFDYRTPTGKSDSLLTRETSVSIPFYVSK